MDKYGKQLAAVEREMRGILAKAREITAMAADSGRAITEDEEAKVKGYLGEVEVLKEKRTEIQNAIATRQRVEDAGASIVVEETTKEELPAHRKSESLGDAFVKSEGFQRAREGGFVGAWSTGPVDIHFKTLLEEASGGAQLVGTYAPDVQAGILPKLFQQLTVANLFAQGTTSANLVRFMKESTATSGAAGVAEGAAKPESTLVFSATDVSVKKIATLLPVTDEMLEDVAQLASFINARLALFVQIEEERQLLYGSTADEVAGLFGQIPAANKGMRSSAASANDADHILRAMMRVRESFLEPTGVVIHPNDWEGISLMKDSQARYQGNGPFNNEMPYSLWGLPVIITRNVTEAAPIVGAFATGAQIFRKSGLTVEASNSHSTYFAENKTAIRAEERLALAVYRPEAFATADLGTAGAAT